MATWHTVGTKSIAVEVVGGVPPVPPKPPTTPTSSSGLLILGALGAVALALASGGKG